MTATESELVTGRTYASPLDRRTPRETQAIADQVALEASTAPPAIEAAGLAWTYAGRSDPALDGLTFRLEPGRVLLVLGPSGSGKSTLARALAGLVPHVLPGRWQGSLCIGDLDVARTPARLLGDRVGLVFQDPDSQLVMTRVDDEVAFGLENRAWARPAMTRRVPQALREVGLEGFEKRGTNTLSGGEKQRLAIADVLAPRPSLLVFDEPTANLDPPGMHATLERLSALAERREHTMVLIEHRLEAALPLADDVLLIDEHGRQLAFAPAAAVGREAVALLGRSGAWVPSAWNGHGSGDARIASLRAGTGMASLEPRDTGPMLLRASELEVSYPADESGSHLVLEGVSLTAAAGERIALVGPNGAGKSTLLFALAGLLRPNSGSVRLRALPLDGGPIEELRDPARLGATEVAAHIGLVFQDPELGFVAGTAQSEVEASNRANVRRGASTDGGVAGGAAAVLADFGLGHLADQSPFRLSQGEQRRLSLAATAMQPPAVLLLDEPTFGLDHRGTEAVMRLLDRLRSGGQAQLLATHDPRLLPACDRVVALARGRIVFDGPPDQFLADPPYSPPGPWRDGVREPASPATPK